MLPEYMVFALTPGSLPSFPVRALMASCGASMATEMILMARAVGDSHPTEDIGRKLVQKCVDTRNVAARL